MTFPNSLKINVAYETFLEDNKFDGRDDLFRRVGSLSASLLYKKIYPKIKEACLKKKVICKRENSYLEV